MLVAKALLKSIWHMQVKQTVFWFSSCGHEGVTYGFDISKHISTKHYDPSTLFGDCDKYAWALFLMGVNYGYMDDFLADP